MKVERLQRTDRPQQVAQSSRLIMMEHQATPEWKKLELLIADIQRELAPSAKVTHNAMLTGKLSGTKRQIDVLVEQPIGQFNMLIIIDCKDYSTAVDVNQVGTFASVIEDVGASKGAMVCPRGFTPNALTMAKAKGIELFSLIDTAPHKWTGQAQVGVVFDRRKPTARIRAYGEGGTDIHEIADMTLLDATGAVVGAPMDICAHHWNNGKWADEIGETDFEPVLNDGKHFLRLKNGAVGRFLIFCSIKVRRELFFGYVNLQQIRGLVDQHTGLVHTNQFLTDAISMEEIESSWQRVPESHAPPTDAVVFITCRDIFG